MFDGTCRRLQLRPLRAVAVLAAVALSAGAGLFGVAEAAVRVPVVTAVIPFDAEPSDIAVDPSSHQVYVTTVKSSLGVVSSPALAVIDESGDALTGSVAATIPLGQVATGIAVDPSNHHVYVAGYSAVTVIDESGDASNGKVIAVLPFDPGPTGAISSGPVGLAVDPSSHNLYVLRSRNEDMPGTASEVSVVDESGDADNGNVTSTIHLLPVPGGLVVPSSISVDPSNDNVYVTTYNYDPNGYPGGGNLTVIDESAGPDQGKVTAVTAVGNTMAETPTGIAVDPTTHNVYISTLNEFRPGGSLAVFDESGGADNGDQTDIPLGGLPQDVAVDTTDHDVYVTDADRDTGSSSDSDTVAVVDGTSKEITGLVPVPGGAMEIAVDSASHNSYVSSFQSEVDPTNLDTVSVLGLIGAPADLSMAVTGPAVAADGSTFTEKVTVTNHGPSLAPRATTDLFIPKGVSVASASAATGTNPLVWTDKTLRPGTTVTHTVTLTVASSIHLTVSVGGAVVSATDQDPNPSDNAAITTIRLG